VSGAEFLRDDCVQRNIPYIFTVLFTISIFV
jgi:hypothetical protein